MKAILLAVSIMLHFWCTAQTKIGNITLSDSIAKKYFLDCYEHPDTVRPKNEYDFLSCMNCTIPQEEIQRAKIMADDFNENLKKNNIGEVKVIVHYEAYTDTLYDGILYADYNYKKIAKKITYQKLPAGSYEDWRGYLMPRRPTEADFIKWMAKH